MRAFLSLVIWSLMLTACRQVPAGGPAPDLPPAAPTVISSPTTLPATSTQPTEATVTATAGTESPSIELNIDPAIKDKFSGIEKYLTTEGGRFYATIGGEKYTLQGGWNVHAEMNNPYAPATVDAVDGQGERTTLIWNKEGLSVNAPLSTDIENPTDFSDADKITTLQKFLLQNPDPFTERSKGLPIVFFLTDHGKVSYLRTDDSFGNQSKLTDVWLRYTDPTGKIRWVNPMNLNDVNTRMVIMCTYGHLNTNYSEGAKPEGDRDIRQAFHDYLTQHIELVWPILKADPSYFKNFEQGRYQYGVGDETELYNLLTLPGNRPEELYGFSTDISVYFSQATKEGIGTVPGPVDPGIQEMILPCQIE